MFLSQLLTGILSFDENKVPIPLLYFEFDFPLKYNNEGFLPNFCTHLRVAEIDKEVSWES